MKISLLKESAADETRVALVPDSVRALVKDGMEVRVQPGAGLAAHFPDEEYQAAGATLVADTTALLRDVAILPTLKPPPDDCLRTLPPDAVFIGFLHPATAGPVIACLAERRVTAFAMELIPRISRAQKLDALSSQASVAGYKAALVAAGRLGKYFPMLMTAAGTVPPAKVLVLGAGVAGLQAIATAHRLGANVWGYDIRPVVKEQVESLGAKFLEFDLQVEDAQDAGGYARELTADQKKQQQALLAEKMKEFDVVITTALIPGRPAPVLITADTVRGMRPGSVIVDLAAEAGGNCELTTPGEVTEHGGVIVDGPRNLAATMPTHASQLYARNITELLKLLVKDGALHLDFDDEIVSDACVTHEGKVRKTA